MGSLGGLVQHVTFDTGAVSLSPTFRPHRDYLVWGEANITIPLTCARPREKASRFNSFNPHMGTVG